MSFTFNWPRFSDQFHYDAIQMLNTALNKGNKPPIIADKIEVVELEMGTQASFVRVEQCYDILMGSLYWRVASRIGDPRHW